MIIDPVTRFSMTDWTAVPSERHHGEQGFADWKTIRIGEIRIRRVDYSPGYSADHWCDKGHVIFCIAGEMTTELKDGRTFVLKPGMSYHVGDNADSHRSFTTDGVSLFIVD